MRYTETDRLRRSEVVPAMVFLSAGLQKPTSTMSSAAMISLS